MSGFPWDEAMSFGLGVLKLPPRAFWAMTPRELARAMEGVRGVRGGPLGRDVLAALMDSYPDAPINPHPDPPPFWGREKSGDAKDNKEMGDGR